MAHVPVLLKEVLQFLPAKTSGSLLDVTVGGGGHFFSILGVRPEWKGTCWDRDPEAQKRILERGKTDIERFKFEQKCFGQLPSQKELFDFILADIGISSFQIDDAHRGMSFFSGAPLDFRMNPGEGESFLGWVKLKTTKELEEILTKYGEEQNFKKIAISLKKLNDDLVSSAEKTTEFLLHDLHLAVKRDQLHPLTRTFQALRIAINDELGELQKFLDWAPNFLKDGGRLAVITFHSLEDRKVKRALESLDSQSYKILTPKPLTPSEEELSQNSRSRSAKLRVMEKFA